MKDIKTGGWVLLMEKRRAYDRAARIYDESRPSYPDRVIDWIIKKTGVSSGELLLEIGAGTGQGTFKFADRGYRIHCIEMGTNMARVLSAKGRNYNITVDVASFEDWRPPEGFKTSFIFSATAFHWLDSEIKYQKCYRLLEDGGYLVLFWNDSPEKTLKEVKEAYDLLWQFYPEKMNTKTTIFDLDQKRKREIESSGLFQLVASLNYKWNLKNSREEFLKGFFSQSSYLALDEAKRKKITPGIEELFWGMGEVIETEFFTNAYISRKIGFGPQPTDV